MKHAASLGIDDPLHRILAWLSGCGVTAATGACVGAGAMLTVAVILVVLAIRGMIS